MCSNKWVVNIFFNHGLIFFLIFSFSPCIFAEQKNYDCLIEANQIIEIRSPVTGLIESVPFTRGALIKNGDVLVTLESTVEKSASDVARFKANMMGSIELWRAKVELSGKKYIRRQTLADNQAISVQEREDADQEKRTAEAELKQAKENKELARFEWIEAESQLRRRTIPSPVNGIVVDQFIFPGEVVDTTAQKPILKLAEINPLRIEVILPVALFGSVKVGDIAEIKPEPPLIGSYQVPVTLVDQIVDSASGTFGVRLALENSKHSIPAGIKCTAIFKNKN